MNLRGRRRLSRIRAATLCLLSLGLAMTARAADQNVEGISAPCPPSVAITQIVSTDDGLEIRADGPITARITNRETFNTDVPVQSYSVLTVDIPNAALQNVSPKLTFDTGAFAGLRAIRYRNGGECGLRLRVQPRAISSWQISPIEHGVIISSSTLAEEKRRAEEATLPVPDRGAAAADASYAHSRRDSGDSFDSSQIQAAFAQRLGYFATLRGFVADYHPHIPGGAPFAALGLSGIDLLGGEADVAAGDLSIPYSSTPLSRGSFINSLLIRGGGASLLVNDTWSAQVWGGRAADIGLLRLRTGTTLSEISHDKVWGAQGGWVSSDYRFAASAGWAHSEAVEGSDHDNYIASLEAQPKKSTSLLLAFEKSRGADADGYAVTAEPRINTNTFSLNGFYRSFSRHFQPPFGAGYFANLRHSYGLASSYRPNARLSLSASASQTKTFSIFDPESVGTFSSSRGAAASYVLNRHWSATAFTSSSDVKSESGALLPTNSSTTQNGVGTTYVQGTFSTSVRYSVEHLENRILPELDTDRRVIDADATKSYDVADFYLRTRVASRSGVTHDRDYAVSFGGNTLREAPVGVTFDVGMSRRPAGLALFGFSEQHATVGLRTGQMFHPARAGVQITYQRLKISNDRAHTAWITIFDAGDLVEWGRGLSVSPPLASRAMDLIQSRPDSTSPARVEIRLWIDANHDGRIERDEQGYPGARVRMDETEYVSDRHGVIVTNVSAGEHQVELIAQGDVVDYFVRSWHQKFRVGPGHSRSIEFALVPAGRLSGQIVFTGGELPTPGALSGIRVTADIGGETIEAVSAVDGTFSFGLVPAGAHQVSIDASTLSPEVAVEGADTMSAEVRAKEAAEVRFTLRQATARERYGIPPRNRNAARSQK